MSIFAGEIVDFDEQYINIRVPMQKINLHEFIKQDCQQVLIEFKDSRFISPEQRRKIWALIGEITVWQSGYRTSLSLDDTSFELKQYFLFKTKDITFIDIFSLSNCDMSIAREFIVFLIDFILENSIITKFPLREMCEDIGKYVYACLIHKKCTICGCNGELHHWEAIGMGRDRTTIIHLNMPAINLCRKHHTIAHTKGVNWLINTQHLQPVKIDEQIILVYKLNNNEVTNE